MKYPGPYRLAIIRNIDKAVVQEWDEDTVFEVLKNRFGVELMKRFTTFKRKITKEECQKCFEIAWNHLKWEFKQETIKNPKIF